MPHTCNVYCQGTIHALPALMDPEITPTAADVLQWLKADIEATLPGSTVLKVRPAEVEADTWAQDPAMVWHSGRPVEGRFTAPWLVWIDVPDWPPAS